MQLKPGDHAAIDCSEVEIFDTGEERAIGSTYVGTVISAPGSSVEPFTEDQIVIAAGMKGNITGWTHNPLIVAKAERFRFATDQDWKNAEIWQ